MSWFYNNWAYPLFAHKIAFPLSHVSLMSSLPPDNPGAWPMFVPTFAHLCDAVSGKLAQGTRTHLYLRPLQFNCPCLEAGFAKCSSWEVLLVIMPNIYAIIYHERESICLRHVFVSLVLRCWGWPGPSSCYTDSTLHSGLLSLSACFRLVTLTEAICPHQKTHCGSLYEDKQLPFTNLGGLKWCLVNGGFSPTHQFLNSHSEAYKLAFLAQAYY